MMSTLTLSLIALVAVVVGAVLGYNVWQGRRSRLARERNRLLTKGYFDPEPADAPLVPRRGSAVKPASRWKKAEPAPDAAVDRREPTLEAEEMAAMVAGINRAGGAASPAAQMPLHAVHPDEAGTFGSDDDADSWQEGTRRPATRAQGPSASASAGFTARYADSGGHHVDSEQSDIDIVVAGRPREDDGFPTLVEEADSTVVAHAVAGTPVQSHEYTDPHARNPAQVAARTDTDTAVASRQDAAVSVSAEGATAVADEAPTVAPAPAIVPINVEFRVEMRPTSAINGERLIALTSSIRHVGGKPIRFEVDQGKGDWTPLQSGARAQSLRACLLLANRQGAINPVELSDFAATVEALAEQVKAPLRTIDMAPVLHEARTLDAVAAALDTQLELSVECGEPISPRGLSTRARQLDLQDRGGGRYMAFTEEGDALFTMMAGESSDRVLFVLDVPRTVRAHAPWQAMVASASGCAQAVGGRIVDHAGRGLSVGMIQAIERQLEARFDELDKAGLPAGSPTAMRVFG